MLVSVMISVVAVFLAPGLGQMMSMLASVLV